MFKCRIIFFYHEQDSHEFTYIVIYVAHLVSKDRRHIFWPFHTSAISFILLKPQTNDSPNSLITFRILNSLDYMKWFLHFSHRIQTPNIGLSSPLFSGHCQNSKHSIKFWAYKIDRKMLRKISRFFFKKNLNSIYWGFSKKISENCPKERMNSWDVLWMNGHVLVMSLGAALTIYNCLVIIVLPLVLSQFSIIRQIVPSELLLESFSVCGHVIRLGQIFKNKFLVISYFNYWQNLPLQFSIVEPMVPSESAHWELSNE
jgi:hypothetical protein